MHPTVYASNASEKKDADRKKGVGRSPPPFHPWIPTTLLTAASLQLPLSSSPAPREPLSHSYTQTPLEGPGTRGEYRIMTPEGLRKKRRTREWNDTRETKEAKVRDERAKKTEKNRDERWESESMMSCLEKAFLSDNLT